MANATVLPYVMRYNAESCPEKMVKLAEAIGLRPTGNVAEDKYLLSDALLELTKALGIKTLKEQGISESDFDMLAGDVLKEPVLVKKDVPGFLANRLQHALFREAISIVENGIADAKDVDDAIKYGFGMRLGVMAPMEVIDNAGVDLTYSIHKYLFPHIENSTEPSKLLVEKYEKGDLGFKTGKGFQEWSEEDIAASRKNLIEGLIKVAKALDRL